MAKDPAVLFYTSDFLVGVQGLTMQERGEYITLLCLQHLKGHLTEKEIKLTVGTVSEDVLKKFTTDENGLYFNERMDNEIVKRENFSRSRSENGKKGGRPQKTTSFSVALAKKKLGENENININDISILESNTSLGEEKRGVGEEEERQRVIKSIVDYLNEKSGKRYRSDTQGTTKHINARLNEGYVYDDFVKVIDVKVKEWKGDKKFDKYLRPDTLFNSEKFPAYLNQKGEEDIVQAELEQWPGIIIV